MSKAKTQKSETETTANAGVAAPVIESNPAPAPAITLEVAQPIAHEIVTEGLSACNGLVGEPLRLAFESVFRKLAEVAPWKYGSDGHPPFSAVKSERKVQMQEYAERNAPYQQALRRLTIAADKCGFEASERFSGGVTASGILVIRHSRTLKMRPESTKRAALSFGSGSWKVATKK